MSYLDDLSETLNKEWAGILCTALFIWAISPIIIFSVYGIIKSVFYITFDIDIFTKLLESAIIPWWISIITNFWKFLLEYLFSFIITLFLVHHNILEAITFKDLIHALKKL